jgi:Protein of unknown function (DUF3375)
VEFDDIARLRANSKAWRLLRADNAPFVLSFLHRVFVAENVRAIPATELVGQLSAAEVHAHVPSTAPGW